jgi:integrase
VLFHFVNRCNPPLGGAKSVPHSILTEVGIRATDPPPAGAITVWDGSLKHFGLRVSQGGTKSFIVLLGSGRRQAIGRWPTITLAQARTKAKTILAERTLGKHQPRSIMWTPALDEYIAEIKTAKRETTWYEYERILKKTFPFGTSRLSAISKHDIVSRLDKCKQPSMRKHALVCVKIFFRWAQRRGYLDHTPTDGLVHIKQPTRDRFLTDHELKAVWTAADHSEGHFGKIVKLLILTGQRRGEIAALQSSWIYQNKITLPKEITKNGREHHIPIGPFAAPVLKSMMETTHGTHFLFPARRGSSSCFNGWSKSKVLLDTLSGVTGWTLHDLRRTFASNLAALGVRLEVIEKLLNHQSGSFAGVAGIYNRYDFWPEMVAAVQLWEDRLKSLVGR